MIAKPRLGSAAAALAVSMVLAAAPLPAHGSAPTGRAPAGTYASPAATITTVTSTRPSTSVAGSIISAPLPTLDAGEVALQQAMPGLFGADDLHPAITGDVISVWSQRGCADLLGVLRAGQWALDLVHQPTAKGQRTWVAIMRLGDARALLVLHGGTAACSGQITHDVAVPIHASGAATADGTGRFLSFLCVPEWDSGDSDSGSPSDSADPLPPREFLFGTYLVGGRSFLLVGDLVTKVGTYHVTSAELAKAAAGDEVSGKPTISVELLPSHRDPLALLVSSLGAMLYPLDLGAGDADQTGSAFGDLLNSYPLYSAGPTAAETVTITATSPLAGTVTATALADQQHPSRDSLDFAAPFTCDR